MTSVVTVLLYLWAAVAVVGLTWVLFCVLVRDPVIAARQRREAARRARRASMARHPSTVNARHVVAEAERIVERVR